MQEYWPACEVRSESNDIVLDLVVDDWTSSVTLTPFPLSIVSPSSPVHWMSEWFVRPLTFSTATHEREYLLPACGTVSDDGTT